MGGQKCCGQESCTEPKNDRRCQLIHQVKEILGAVDQSHVNVATNVRPGRTEAKVRRGVGRPTRNLEQECAQWRKRRDNTPPLITKIALHETRPTSMYSVMRHENHSNLTYVDATREGAEQLKVPPAPWDLPRCPSQELRAGNLHVNCRCLKRDGLQHDCLRWECSGRPECVAVNPGPCCIPSQWPKPIRGHRRYGNRKRETTESANFERRELKTGPLNPAVCTPKDKSSPQNLGFIAGGNVMQTQNQGGMGANFLAQAPGLQQHQHQHHGLVAIIPLPQEHGLQQHQHHQHQGMVGMIPLPQGQHIPGLHGQPTQGSPQEGPVNFVDMRIAPQLNAVRPPMQGGEVMIEAPGVQCRCRPIGVRG